MEIDKGHKERLYTGSLIPPCPLLPTEAVWYCIDKSVSGEGIVGSSSYLVLWEKREIEELNNEYETQEFLSNILLIGSDGGDMAYGIDINGRYIEVPFIGMADGEVKIIAEDFDNFIKYVWSKEL